ncbi:MAG: hypothetical protein ABL921_04930 [Pirellula sp.]
MMSRLLANMDDWNQFWFSARAPGAIAMVRMLIGAIAAIQFAMYLFAGANWLGANGWFDQDAGLYFVGNDVQGTGSQYRWSILYAVPGLVPVVAIVGLIGSLATLLGLGSRLAPLVAWIALTQFHHRAPFLVSTHEPLLGATLAYLLVDTGRLNWTLRPGICSGSSRISANISLQLIRTHFWIWVGFSLSSMLANSSWWNGEACWLLIQSGHGWIPLSDGWQWVAHLFTHGVIGSQFGILVATTHPQLRWLGRWFLYFFLMCIVLFLGDWLYAAVLLATSTAIWPLGAVGSRL